MLKINFNVSVNDLTMLAEYNIRTKVTHADVVKAKLRNFILKKKKREIYISCLYLQGGDPKLPYASSLVAVKTRTRRVVSLEFQGLLSRGLFEAPHCRVFVDLKARLKRAVAA
jgi:hypothetical protein